MRFQVQFRESKIVDDFFLAFLVPNLLGINKYEINGGVHNLSRASIY